jgi:shikimate kinase
VPDVILIGPPGTGKSTIGKLLAERLGIPQVSLDKLRYAYYAEVGYDESLAQSIRAMNGFPALVQYWKQFDAHAVERVLADHHDCVIDFGAGHSIYDDPVDFQRVERLVEPYQNVILVLPSPDREESIQILTERQQTLAPPADREIIGGLIRYHVMHPSDYRLAKRVVYTKNKTPEETAAEVIGYLIL